MIFVFHVIHRYSFELHFQFTIWRFSIFYFHVERWTEFFPHIWAQYNIYIYVCRLSGSFIMSLHLYNLWPMIRFSFFHFYCIPCPPRMPAIKVNFYIYRILFWFIQMNSMLTKFVTTMDFNQDVFVIRRFQYLVQQ